MIQGRVECSGGEWSDLGERGVVDPERLAETGHRTRFIKCSSFLRLRSLDDLMNQVGSDRVGFIRSGWVRFGRVKTLDP